MTLDKFRLDGKTALVTGCKRGIGLAMAQGLSEAGADVIGVSASLEASGSEVEAYVTALGRKFSAYRCDFGDRDAVYSFIKQVKSEHDTLDILVNNAGTVLRKPAAEHPDDYWDKVIEVNLNAQFILSRMGKNTRPSFDLIDLQLPRWLTYALALSGALALFGPGQFKVIGTGLALAFAVPLFFLGLTVIHTYCRKIAAGFIVLILVYGILLFVPWIGAGLAGLGILEGWLKLRDRASGSS